MMVPAAELDLPELRVVERVPVDVALAVELLVAPAQQLQVVLGRVLAEPLDEACSPSIPASRCGLQNSVVQANTPRWS